MSSHGKQALVHHGNVEQSAPKTGGLLSSYSKQQDDLPSLAKRSSSQQFAGPRAKSTVPLGQPVQPPSKPVSPVPASPSSGQLLAGQFKTRTTPLSPSTASAPTTINTPQAQPVSTSSSSSRGQSLGISSSVKMQGVFVN